MLGGGRDGSGVAIADVLFVLFQNEHYKPLKTKRKIFAEGCYIYSKLLKTLYKRGSVC